MQHNPHNNTPPPLPTQSLTLSQIRQKNKQAYYQSLPRLPIPIPIIPISQDPQDNSVQQISGTEVEKLTEVIKDLVIKNKLTARNAFEVPVIDVNLLGAIREDDQGSWRKVSNVLENSSKIYGFRVDFMAESINKMTNNIARNQKSSEIQKLKPSTRHYSTCQDSMSIPNNPQNNSWTEQIYDRYLEKQKINQKQPEGHNYFQQEIRRMFDQNGIASLLMARLPIGPALNVVIDAGIGYGKREARDGEVEVGMGMGFDLGVLDQIARFREFCFNRGVKEEVEEFCQEPEVFRCEDFHGFQQGQIESICEENQLNRLKHQVHPSFGLSSLEKIEENSPDNFSLFSVLIEPFGQRKAQKKSRGRKKGKTKEKNPRQKKQKEIKKEKEIVKQESYINFSACLQNADRSSILSTKNISLNLDVKKRRNQKDKHLFKKIIPDFNVELSVNYQAFQGQIQEKFDPKDNILTGLQEIESFTQALPYSQLLSQLGPQEKNILAMPDIRSTKAWLWQNIRQHDHCLLSGLHSLYEKEKGTVSETILFLAALHLGNERNLQISEGPNFQIQIINNNPQRG